MIRGSKIIGKEFDIICEGVQSGCHLCDVNPDLAHECPCGTVRPPYWAAAEGMERA